MTSQPQGMLQHQPCTGNATLNHDVSAADASLAQYQLLQNGTMVTGGSRPRQFQAPIASTHPRARHKLQGKAKKHKVTTERPAAPPLLPPPQSKAIAPYASKSQAEDSNLRFLIYHFVTARTVTNVGPRFEWYPLAVRDEAFFHAVVSSTSSHAAYLQQVDLPRNFYFHRGEAIRMVNKRIADGSHDEGTINTVAIFSQQESFEGRPASSKIHLEGLLQLVRAAGGMDSSELSAKTRRFIFLTELSACIVLDRPAELPPTLLSDLETYFRPPSFETASYVKTFGIRLYNFTGSALADRAADVLWGLRNVSAILEAIHDGTETPDTPSADDVQFSDRVEVLQRLVNHLWCVSDSENEQNVVFRTFGWTCLIYIYCTLRELPPQLGMNSMLASRIKTALEACPDLNVLLATFQDLMLWQMFICGRVADARDRPFFASQATKVLHIRKIETPIDIIVASEGFLWPERLVRLPVRASRQINLVSDDEDRSDGTDMGTPIEIESLDTRLSNDSP